MSWNGANARPFRPSGTSQRGDYRTTPDGFCGARFITNAFGGSHAQSDIIDWTLTEAAVRGRLTSRGEAFANERLALKPHSPVNRSFQPRTGANLTPQEAPSAKDTPTS